MSSDYLELLDPDALGILAETTGFASRDDAPRYFAERPNGIRLALGSPAAASLLAPGLADRTHSQRLLMSAISVHRTAEEICSAGWTARDDSPVDLPLVRFAGQGDYQAFMVDLLVSHLPTDLVIPGLDLPSTEPGTPARLDEFLDLCATVAETERAGALRLLGDEALFISGMFPGRAAEHPVTPELLERLEAVLPKAVRGLLDDIRPELHSQLDLYLYFGPVWYRMASQNLLHTSMRNALGDLAKEFSTARRFLVRIAQGPLNELRHELFQRVRC